jgi:hypothetical protein
MARIETPKESILSRVRPAGEKKVARAVRHGILLGGRRELHLMRTTCRFSFYDPFIFFGLEPAGFNIIKVLLIFLIV